MNSAVMPTVSDVYRKMMECTCVCTDTRKLTEGCFFVALKGDHFDANEFAPKALEMGAKYALISDLKYENKPGFIYTPDTLRGLQALARTHRRQFNIPIVAITGTNGKTTTKELITAVLDTKYHVLATEGNLNNHIGVPLTLLNLRPHHQVAVIEMGANHRGEILDLVNIAEPTMGLITNIGAAHLEGFGTIENILETKSELAMFLTVKGGKFILNLDDELLRKKWEKKAFITYGSTKEADVTGRVVTTRASRSKAFLTVEVYIKSKRHRVETQLVGTYNLHNILAAMTTGALLDVNMEKACNAIRDYSPSNSRSQLIETERYRIFLDAYNANLTSMKAAIHSATTLRSEGTPLTLILGDMLEMGADSERVHKEILSIVAEIPNCTTYLIGDSFGKALASLDKKVKDHAKLFPFAKTSDLLSLWENSPELQPAPRTSILIKGSRGMALEKLLPILAPEKEVKLHVNKRD